MSRAENNVVVGESASGADGVLSWIKSGTLQVLSIQGADDVVYTYEHSSGQRELVSGSMHAVQSMIGAEFRARPGNEDNVLKRIDDILFELMSHKGPLKVTRGLLYEFEEEPHHKRLMQVDEQVRSTYRRLSECVAASSVKHDAAVWSTEFFVLNPDGSLEKWSASGASAPFSIKSWRVDVILTTGSLKYMPRPGVATNPVKE